MSDIKLSIIVPIYNVEQYLSQCLDSLLNQTLRELEVILVNDGTKDSSDIIAKKYANQYPNKFRYIEKTNGGLSDARNYAIPYAKGEYIAFVDSDDYVASTMFEKMYAAAKSNNANIVECEFKLVYENNKINKTVTFPTYKNLKDCLINAYPNAWNKIYKRDWLLSLNVFFPKGLWHEDIEFYFKIIPYSNSIPLTIHEPLYYYRQRNESIMNKPDIRILDLHKVYKNIYSYYSDKGLLKEYESAIEYKYLKTTCCNFLKRMLKIKDQSFKSAIINESWRLFTTQCPNWRQNNYLWYPKIINIYLLIMNRSLLWFLDKITKLS